MEYYDELYHYGVKGMKWGVRRYMNADGDVFRVHGGSNKNYNTKNSKVVKTYGEHLYEVDNKKLQNKIQRDAAKASLKEQKQAAKQQKKPMSTKKKVAIGAAATAAIVGGAYGAYKLNKYVKDKSFQINLGKRMLEHKLQLDSFVQEGYITDKSRYNSAFNARQSREIKNLMDKPESFRSAVRNIKSTPKDTYVNPYNTGMPSRRIRRS